MYTTTMDRTLEYIITKEFHNRTIADFLSAQNFCHQTIVYLKQTPNGIMQNGIWVHVTGILREHDVLRLHWVEPHQASSVVPVCMDLDILYEDEDILLINKASDTPIHPSMGNYHNTLANGVMAYYESKGCDFTFRCINRLDRDTTGLTIIAKNCQSAGILSRRVASREVHRTYLAICEGQTNEKGTILAPICRKDDSTIERCVNFEKGESAITHYTRLSYNENLHLSLVRIQLETGRTHQIRVHMKHLGHPLIGDFLYNPNMNHMKRQALHSYSLDFLHPVTNESCHFIAPLPEDMRRLFPSVEVS